MEFKEVFTKLLLEKTGSNQSKLSELSGIPIPTINGWLTQNKSPGMEHLIRLSRCFGVSVDYLVGLEEDDSAEKAATATLTKAQRTLISKIVEMEDKQVKALLAILS